MEGTLISEVKSTLPTTTPCVQSSSSRHLAVVMVYFLWFYFVYSSVGTGRELQGQSMGGGRYQAIPVG